MFWLAATDWELLEAKEESRSCRGVPKSVPKGRVGRIADCALAASVLRLASVMCATGRWAQEWRCAQGGQIQMNPAVHHFRWLVQLSNPMQLTDLSNFQQESRQESRPDEKYLDSMQNWTFLVTLPLEELNLPFGCVENAWRCLLTPAQFFP